MTGSEAPNRGSTALAVDAGLICMLLAAALLTGSLAVLGETARSASILARELWGIVTGRAGASGSSRRYEFGVGKLEDAGGLVIAIATAVAGLWLAGLVIGLIATGASQTTPRGLALAGAALALLTLRSGVAVLASSRARGDGSAPAARLRSGSGSFRFGSLLVVQLAITLGALATDPLATLVADALGAAFLALVMTFAGVRMAVGAVSDLIDHPLDRRHEAYVAELVRGAGVDDRELLDLRSRRSGRRVFVELTIGPTDAGSFEEARQRMIRLRRALTGRGDDLDVAIRLRTPAG